MKKYWWILGILLVLVLLTLRESYTNYEEALRDVGQTAGYTSLEPKCPEGSVLNAGKTMCKFADSTKADVVPTCEKDTLEFVGGTCRPKATSATTPTGTTSASTATTEPVPGKAATTSASQSSTGGSSTSSYGPNSGGVAGKGRSIFGPTSNGMGDSNGKVRPVDSTKTNQYPELMGGKGKDSTRIDGAGIVDPSKNWQLAMDGSLPNCTSLGCDENSKYFPYSRQPGDMELIPDPYRVSQQFSSASYSFKTEPTPFLTDFSAFLR